MFGNLDRAQAMFGSTVVTGYPGRARRVSDQINHHIWRGGEGWISPHESVVGEWAYVKELAVMDTRGRGE